MTRFYARVPMMPNDWAGQTHLAVRWRPAEVAGDSQECLSYETNFAPLLNRCKFSQLAGFQSGGPSNQFVPFTGMGIDTSPLNTNFWTRLPSSTSEL